MQTRFESRRSLAQGFTVAGQSLGTFAWSPLAVWLFQLYGWRGAFLIIGGLQLNGVVLAMLLSPSKLPHTTPLEHSNKSVDKNLSSDAKSQKCFDLSFLKNAELIMIYISFIFNQFGHHLPMMWLPTRGVDAGVSDTEAALLVSVNSKTFIFTFYFSSKLIWIL